MNEAKANLQAEIQSLQNELSKNTHLLKTEDSIGMRILLEEEIKNLNEQINALTASLNSLDEQYNLTSSTETNDAGINPNIAILEIRAGAGGDEAGIFAYDLYRMYCRYSEKVGWKVKELNKSENIIGGIKTITSEIKGKNIYELLKNESGVHRVQRIPITESEGRIHTSTATVAILPEVSKVDIEIKPEDVKMDFFRAGGHGGQNVNKVSAAVRLTHIPTGVIVECQEERTQLKNREKAMSILKSRIYTMMQEQQVKNIADLRSEQVGSGGRSEKIRTYNFPQNRVTDHRFNKSRNNIEAIMNGEIEQILKFSSGELEGKMS